MATSVKMLEKDKHRLDRLQGEIMVREGRRVPQQEILSWLLDLGEAEKQRLASDASRPVSPREMTALKRLVVRGGPRTREEDIDATMARSTQ
jgi:hypothetical protein